MTDDATVGPDNARAGYQVAAQLWAYEGQAVWSAFNAMLVANAIVIAAEGATGTFTDLPALRCILPIFGLLLSLLWYALVDRGFTIHSYRVLSTRNLEHRLNLSETDAQKHLDTVARGATVNDGGVVSFTFPGDTNPHNVRLTFFAKLLRGRELALIVALLFAGFHVVVLAVMLGSYICGGHMICNPRWLNTAGLVVDVIGVILLFVAVLASRQPGSENRVTRRWAMAGLGLLLVGFVLQAIGSWSR